VYNYNNNQKTKYNFHTLLGKHNVGFTLDRYTLYSALVGFTCYMWHETEITSRPCEVPLAVQLYKHFI